MAIIALTISHRQLHHWECGWHVFGIKLSGESLSMLSSVSIHKKQRERHGRGSCLAPKHQILGGMMWYCRGVAIPQMPSKEVTPHASGAIGKRGVWEVNISMRLLLEI